MSKRKATSNKKAMSKLVSNETTVDKNKPQTCALCRETHDPEELSGKQLFFDFDYHRILGVFGNDIHVEGATWQYDSYNLCVLVIDEELYKFLLNEWLMRKKAFCLIDEGYSGKGLLTLEEYELCGEAGLDVYEGEDEVEHDYVITTLSCPMYRVLSCSIDMF